MAASKACTGRRLKGLRRDLTGVTEALSLFWEEVSSQGTPLVEPIPGDGSHSLVAANRHLRDVLQALLGSVAA